MVVDIYPLHAEATFIQSTRMHRFLKKTFKPCHVSIHGIALTDFETL